MPFKHVYFFGGGTADGSRVDRELLGGKGADLAEMARLGVNVPPGFTIATAACHAYLAHNEVPPDVRTEVRDALTGRTLGDWAIPGLDERVDWRVSQGAGLLAEETRVSVFELPA